MHMLSTVVAALAVAQGAVASPWGYYPWTGAFPTATAPPLPTATGTSYPVPTGWYKEKREAAIDERELFGFFPTGTAPSFPTGTGFPTGYYAKEKREFPTGGYYPTGFPTGFPTGAFPTATGWSWRKMF